MRIGGGVFLFNSTWGGDAFHIVTCVVHQTERNRGKRSRKGKLSKVFFLVPPSLYAKGKGTIPGQGKRPFLCLEGVPSQLRGFSAPPPLPQRPSPLHTRRILLFYDGAHCQLWKSGEGPRMRSATLPPFFTSPFPVLGNSLASCKVFVPPSMNRCTERPSPPSHEPPPSPPASTSIQR